MAKEKKIKVKNKKEKKPREYKPLSTYFTQKTLLGVTLAGVLLLLAIYVFVYQDYTQKTKAIEASNKTLADAVAELEEYNANIEQYKLEIEEFKTEAEAIMDMYPSDTREEDAIMLAVNMQSNNIIDFDAINMEEKESVYVVEPQLVQAAALEGLDESLVFTQKHAIYVNETTYKELKSVIQLVYESDNRIGIDNIIYTKDEEYGILKGNIDIYFYGLAGTGKEYTAPDITPYDAGTDDPFRSEETARQMVMDVLDEMMGESGEDGSGEADGLGEADVLSTDGV